MRIFLGARNEEARIVGDARARPAGYGAPGHAQLGFAVAGVCD